MIPEDTNTVILASYFVKYYFINNAKTNVEVKK